MTPDLWQRIKDVLEQVEAASAADRAAILERLCEGDSELRREVDPFLADEAGATFLHAAIGEQAASLSQGTARQERFGRYQVVRRIGMGGMGAVYEAVRVDDFHKKVALKIIKQGLDSDFARTRFLQERQLLASLEHPYIAGLLDGGESDDGSPYLVLEFVDGQPITEYCAKLDRTARLRLFLKVCEAVEHAHRNLVVHRDLKPANILVTASGDPKLLDFGIAKLLDPGAALTQTGFAALTPDYASPEQVRGEPITTASDVYSLGVILYQLLTDRKPYSLETSTALEMDKVICQTPPANPGLGDELDQILLMALRKEPERRYGGVQRFAEDIERYLDHRPVSARPDTIRYRTKKFVRRNWWQMAAVTVVIFSLTAGLAVSLAAQRRATRRFNQVRQLANRFLFDFHDEIATTPGTVKARQMIVSTALEYLNSLAPDAKSDVGLQWELVVAYGKVAAAQGSTTKPSLGQRQEAKASYEKAFALARPLADRKLLTDSQRQLLVDLLDEASVARLSLLEYDDAVRLGRESVQRSEGLAVNTQRRVLSDLASVLSVTGDLMGSVSARERILPLVRESAQRDPSFENRMLLATLLANQGYLEARLTGFEAALAYETEAATLIGALAAERPKEATMQRRIFLGLYYLALTLGAGERPSLGRTHEAVGRLEEALKAIEVMIAADPNDHASRSDAGMAHTQIATILADVQPEEAIRHAAIAWKLCDAATPDNDETRAGPRAAAADAHRVLGQFAQSEGLLKEADRILAHPSLEAMGDIKLSWARLKAAQNDPSAAGLFAESIGFYEQALAKTPTPAIAWAFTHALEYAAEAVPETAQSRRERALAVWTEQNRRYPGHAYLEQQVKEAQDRLAGK